LQELEICFEQRTGEAEFQVLSSMRKTSLSQMEQTTGWLAEGTPVDITARYFAFRIRDTNAEDVTPSELAQLRARYYLRGHR